MQGLVLDWRRQSYRWTALVVTVETDDAGRPVVRHEWVTPSGCGPCGLTRTEVSSAGTDPGRGG